MGTVHYIGWYVGEQEESIYKGNVPAVLKMRYITNLIQHAGKKIRIFSLAKRVTGGGYLYRRKKVRRNDLTIVYSMGLNSSNKFLSRINGILKEFEFIRYVLFSVKPTDTIILYHSVTYTRLLAKLRRFVRRHVILEVEEIYGYAAQGDDKRSLDIEFNTIPMMDEYILINDYLQREFNLPKEKCVPCYGVVNLPQREKERSDDGKIHVVYAGTIEGRKQGAAIAVETALCLPDNYVTHILGFGKDKHIEALKKRITEINEEKGREAVLYHGFMSGKELDNFLFSCHIGLSTYVQRDVFANNSLPSKILTYMCHDLAVVRGEATAFSMMDISKFWTLYREGTPQDVADAVQKSNIPQIGANAEYLLACDKKVVAFMKKYC